MKLLTKEEKKALLRLANVLEDDNIAICSRMICDKYTEVFFLKDGKEFFTLGRVHNSAYAIRGACGMSSQEANAFYNMRKRILSPTS